MRGGEKGVSSPSLPSCPLILQWNKAIVKRKTRFSTKTKSHEFVPNQSVGEEGELFQDISSTGQKSQKLVDIPFIIMAYVGRTYRLINLSFPNC